MSERTWVDGPPPHIGWWNASKHRNPNVWRWWNGFYFSGCAIAENTAELAECIAKHAAVVFDEDPQIQWSDYWPENARVPRIAP